MKRGAIETARAIYAHALSIFPGKQAAPPRPWPQSSMCNPQGVACCAPMKENGLCGPPLGVRPPQQLAVLGLPVFPSTLRHFLACLGPFCSFLYTSTS